MQWRVAKRPVAGEGDFQHPIRSEDAQERQKRTPLWTQPSRYRPVEPAERSTRSKISLLLTSTNSSRRLTAPDRQDRAGLDQVNHPRIVLHDAQVEPALALRQEDRLQLPQRLERRELGRARQLETAERYSACACFCLQRRGRTTHHGKYERRMRFFIHRRRVQALEEPVVHDQTELTLAEPEEREKGVSDLSRDDQMAGEEVRLEYGCDRRRLRRRREERLSEGVVWLRRDGDRQRD